MDIVKWRMVESAPIIAVQNKLHPKAISRASNLLKLLTRSVLPLSVSTFWLHGMSWITHTNNTKNKPTVISLEDYGRRLGEFGCSSSPEASIVDFLYSMKPFLIGTTSWKHWSWCVQFSFKLYSGKIMKVMWQLLNCLPNNLKPFDCFSSQCQICRDWFSL